MSLRASILLTVIGSFLIALACVWYGVVEGWPTVRVPWSTPATRVGSVVGVMAIGVGVWLVAWLWLRPRSRRRRQQSKRPRAAGGGKARDEAAAPAHGGAGGAANQDVPVDPAGRRRYVTAGPARAPLAGRDRPDITELIPAYFGQLNETIPFPSPAIGGLRDGRQVHPPGHAGRPTSDVRSSRAGVRVERMVSASAMGGVEAGTPQLPPSCLERGARRWVVVGADEGPAPATFQASGGGPGTAVRPQTWTAGKPPRMAPGRYEIDNHR